MGNTRARNSALLRHDFNDHRKDASLLHVLTLFAVQADAADTFICFIHDDFRTLGRLVAPDLIATDLLEHQSTSYHPLLSISARLFIALDFWTTQEAYQRACPSPECQGLLLERRRWAVSSFEFGAFAFPKRLQPGQSQVE